MTIRELAVEIKQALETNLWTFERFFRNGKSINMYFKLDGEVFKVTVEKEEI
jgi:hypothetical protein